MKEQLNTIYQEFLDEISKASSLEELEKLRVAYLGKKGKITAVMKGMKSLSKEERPVIGQLANDIRSNIENGLTDKREALEKERLDKKLKEEVIDVTLPGKKQKRGSYHPLNKVIKDLEDIFIGMGFKIVDGPDIEWSKYNFDYLNMPPEHSSRDLSETFYVDTTPDQEILLRTQTSSVQARALQENGVPIRVVVPGRVYRADEIDATHSPVFHQIEGLVVDENISMSDLKGTLDLIAKKIFGEDTKTRFRPHQFYFTEPSAEMDVSCFNCGGKGCRVCQNTGWIELLGCGMVHPNVLKQCGIDPEKYSGYAFGIGLDRMAMMKYGINDLRLLFDNDLRFLEQFKVED